VLSITDVLREHGVDFREFSDHKNVREGWIGVCCPYCGDLEGKFHLGIEVDASRATCWVCGWHPLADVLKELTGEPYSACQTLSETLHEPTAAKDRLPRGGKLRLPAGIGKFEEAHRRYLEGRQFDLDELSEKWGVAGIGIAARLAWRIFVPITHEGETVSWTTRSLSKRGRYINASAEEEIVNPKSFLFGEEHCIHTIIIVEGPFDLFKVGYGAVATMGVGYSPEQFARMTKYPNRIVCFDNEPIAQRRALTLCNDLEEYPGETTNVVLKAKDPGSAFPFEISQLRKKFLV